MEPAVAWRKNELPKISILIRSAARLGRRTAELMDRSWEDNGATVLLNSEKEFEELLQAYPHTLYSSQLPEYYYVAAVNAYTQALTRHMLDGAD